MASHPAVAQKSETHTHKIVQLYLYIAMLYLVVFVPIFVLVIRNPLLTTVHLIDVVIVAWAHWSFRSQPKPQVVTLALCAIAYLTVTSVMVTGGAAQSGPFLVFPYIPFVVFMRPPPSAQRWLIAMLFTMIGLLFLGLVDLITLPYRLTTFALLSFNYLLAVLLTLAYVREKSIADGLLEKKVAEVEDTKSAMLSMVEDLNNEKELTQKAIAKDEAILASIGEGLIAFDSQGRVERLNRRAEKLLGYSQTKLHGKSYVDAVEAVDNDEQPINPNDRPVSQAIKTKQTISITCYYKRKNGSTFPVQLTVAPILIDGDLIGAIEIFRDITREKEIDKAKTEFVSLASHQLRTPLSTINWYAEMLLAGDAGRITKEQAKYLDEIYRGNRRMADLVSALLNVSRIDLGTFSVEPEPTDLVKLSEMIVKDLEPRIFERKIDFQEVYPAKLPIVNVDPKLMRMVIENLASNAVKYTPTAGKVTLKLESHRDMVVITIEDNGYGIPKRQQSRIFSKLFRADNVKAQDTEGTGLGLYIVKSIVDYSGGKIWFESAENKGTTFFVSLPIQGMKHKPGSKPLD